MSANPVQLPFGSAICYSGYRLGQSPREEIFPSYAEVHEDLRILAEHFSLLRIYDISLHATLVLDVIRNERLPLQVMLGNDLRAEQNNPECPWGAVYSAEQLADNYVYNRAGVARLIELANDYADIVFAVSIGNEASVDWSDHLVPVESLLEFARSVKTRIRQPITFCENYVPWGGKLDELGDLLDVISLHTYPVWEYKSIDEALAYTQENYAFVKQRYPDKPVIITEAGWCTRTNGRGMETDRVSEAFQLQYVRELKQWSEQEQILVCMFEAFDEPWKGSDDPLEPEKHWGFYFEDRSPKRVITELYEAEAGTVAAATDALV